MFDKKEYQKEWNKNHPKKAKEYNKKYYQKNREKKKKYEREWYLKNSEREKKRKREYYNTHPEYRKNKLKNNKQWQKNNREKRKEYFKKRYQKMKQFIDDYKLSKGCAICGYKKYAEVLEFHHNNRDKEFSIGGMKNYTLKKIKKEMEKCVLLCANCHRELHIKEKIGVN